MQHYLSVAVTSQVICMAVGIGEAWLMWPGRAEVVCVIGEAWLMKVFNYLLHRDYMACALVTKTCANLTTNHMKTQNDRDLDTCVRSSARFPWFRVEFCFALISCCKRKQCPIIFFWLL